MPLFIAPGTPISAYLLPSLTMNVSNDAGKPVLERRNHPPRPQGKRFMDEGLERKQAVNSAGKMYFRTFIPLVCVFSDEAPFIG
jgi:hypothetical protein